MIHNGNCLDIMPTLPADSVDSIVTDPPYGLSFMGKDWDHGVPGVHFWAEALRVAKPGAFLLAFGGTRTFHRLAVAIEDAGWEIRDTVMWVYGSGFPKSLDVGKAIDKANGAEREVVGTRDVGPDIRGDNYKRDNGERMISNITAPATDAAREWNGWGTALKPAWEPIIVARKPLIGTVAENVLRYGTGAINVDAARVGNGKDRVSGGAQGSVPHPRDWGVKTGRDRPMGGRWPANLIHDGSDEVLAGFPQTTQASWRKPQPDRAYPDAIFQQAHKARERDERGHNDTGSAARFFYCAKASKSDRDEGCEGLEARTLQAYGDFAGTPEHGPKQDVKARNHHPTVKPTALMRYLVKLVTRRGGVVLDPFMGSGSTGKACAFEGMEFIGIDLSSEYCEIAARRIAAVVQPALTR